MQGPREHDEFVVTHDSKEVLGVDCVVVRDTASITAGGDAYRQKNSPGVA